MSALAVNALAGCEQPRERDPASPQRSALVASPSITATDKLLVAIPPLSSASSCNHAIARGPTTDTCASSDLNWTGEALVATSNNVYCHFAWTGAGSPRFEALKAPNRVAEPDCPVVGLQGAAPPLDPALWTGLHKAFVRQAGGTRFRPPQVSSNQRGNVTVAILDSAAWSYGTATEDDTFGHGRLMGRIIADLACPLDSLLTKAPTSCPLAIRNVLAVPRLPTGGSDSTNGGYFGTRGELAAALRTTLATFEKVRDSRQHLVVNLSLGWEGTLPPDLASPLADEAVRMLLVRASCLGAVVVAAAGNKNTVTDAGPFFPAAWQATPAPTADTCALLRPALTPDPSIKLNRPLVYAVAAVDGRDRPLLNARPELPRLLAPGLGAVTDDNRGPGHTLVLSGSSLAAAVVSGIAAAIWQSGGTLTGPDVMNTVYEGAIPLLPGVVPGAGTTGLCLGSPPCSDQQRRVSLCRALDKIGVTHDTCVVPAAGRGPVARVPLPVALGSTDDAGAAGVDAAAATDAASPDAVLPDASSPDLAAADAASPLNADAGTAAALVPTPACAGPSCPVWAPASEKTPAVWTQPNGPACPSCVLFACCNWVFGQISPDMLIAKSAISTTAWLFTDPVPWGLPYKIEPATPFWLQSPGGTRAAIAFEFEGDWPGTGVVLSHVQDIPVVAP